MMPVDTEFESTTDNPALVDALRRRIETEGPITFHDYMETALYHPQLGYYATREPMGRSGDYLTSPEVHPIFAALAGKQLAQQWRVLGEPACRSRGRAGRGPRASRTTCSAGHAARSAVLRRDALSNREICPSLQERQRQTLRAARPACRPGRMAGRAARRDRGIVLTNELLDSLGARARTARP
jgi:SAM-dependent MidA family methyltransferase